MLRWLKLVDIDDFVVKLGDVTQLFVCYSMSQLFMQIMFCLVCEEIMLTRI